MRIDFNTSSAGNSRPRGSAAASALAIVGIAAGSACIGWNSHSLATMSTEQAIAVLEQSDSGALSERDVRNAVAVLTRGGRRIAEALQLKRGCVPLTNEAIEHIREALK